MSRPDARDDRFHHPPEPDPTWAETCWFGFSVPERGMAGTLYPLFRTSLGVCALGVAVWDASGSLPWRARYARRLWHVPTPEGDLDDFAIEGLVIQCIDPLERYRVSYQDGERIHIELEYEGLIAPHAPLATDERGHLDQPCRVCGTLRLDGEEIRVDGYEMRDRTWGPRDDKRRTRASYSYGILDGNESFLASTVERDGEERVQMGFLVRDGEKHDLVSGVRRVKARGDGWPAEVHLEATDRAGRTLDVDGRCLSRLAEQATPGMFAWMSLTEWTGSIGPCYGEDQEVWSPDTWPLGIRSVSG